MLAAPAGPTERRIDVDILLVLCAVPSTFDFLEADRMLVISATAMPPLPRPSISCGRRGPQQCGS